MKLQFIDKVFEKSTPIFLAGVLFLLLGAMGGVTIGKTSLQINENIWRIFLSVVGFILTFTGIYFQLIEGRKANPLNVGKSVSLVETDLWKIDNFKKKLENAKDIRMIATSNYNLLSNLFIEFKEFIKRDGTLRCIYVNPDSEALKKVALRNIDIESNIKHLKGQYEQTVDAVRDLAKHSRKNDTVQVKKTDYLHGTVITIIDANLPSAMAYVTINGFGHHYATRPCLILYNEKHPEWFKFMLETFDNLWESPDCETVTVKEDSET